MNKISTRTAYGEALAEIEDIAGEDEPLADVESDGEEE